MKYLGNRQEAKQKKNLEIGFCWQQSLRLLNLSIVLQLLQIGELK